MAPFAPREQRHHDETKPDDSERIQIVIRNFSILLLEMLPRVRARGATGTHTQTRLGRVEKKRGREDLSHAKRNAHGLTKTDSTNTNKLKKRSDAPTRISLPPRRLPGMSPTDVPLYSMVTATMNSEEAVPYIWSECQPPSDQVLKMWYEVGNKLDKDSTG
jgi:hypothetical protein